MDKFGKLLVTLMVAVVLVGGLFVLEYYDVWSFIQSVSVELVGAVIVGLTTWAITSTSKTLIHARELRLQHFHLWQSASRGPKYIDSDFLISFANRTREKAVRYGTKTKRAEGIIGYARSIEGFESFLRRVNPQIRTPEYKKQWRLVNDAFHEMLKKLHKTSGRIFEREKAQFEITGNDGADPPAPVGTMSVQESYDA